ncbi:40S ribosomal protein S7 [Dictyocoela muelleri]|nr:40S ribosomal protein S7 [Dictyocoela muelleri]
MTTEGEKKIKSIISKYTNKDFKLNLQILNIDDSNVMVIILPLQVLDDIHRHFEKVGMEIKRIFKSPLFFLREPSFKNTGNVNKQTSEKWLLDLCFPAYVTGRMTEVDEDKIEKVFVERKCDFDDEDFYLMSRTFYELTGMKALYELSHY